jgi:hypothetical protein
VEELNSRLARSPTSKLLSTTVAVAVAAMAVIGQQARAEEPPKGMRESGTLARQIQEELDHEACRERIWWNGWMTAYGALTVGQGVAAGLSGDYDTRADLGVGAATSFLGVVGLLISHLPEIGAAADALRAMPSDGIGASRARDEAAIALREQAASAEREERSWVAHALNFAVATGSTVVLWKGFDRGASSAANFATSLAVGELQIWTQPAALIATPGGRLTTTSLPQTPALPQKSLGLAWSGRVLRIVLAF